MTKAKKKESISLLIKQFRKEQSIETKRDILEDLYKKVENSNFTDKETGMMGVEMAYNEINTYLENNEPHKIEEIRPSNLNHFLLAIDFMDYSD